MTDEPRYLEHEKLRAIVDKSQAIGEFVEWLEYEKQIHLCEYVDRDLFHTRTSMRDLLAEFFGIDQKKIDAEKDAMLEQQRKLNAT